MSVNCNNFNTSFNRQIRVGYLDCLTRLEHTKRVAQHHGSAHKVRWSLISFYFLEVWLVFIFSSLFKGFSLFYAIRKSSRCEKEKSRNSLATVASIALNEYT